MKLRLSLLLSLALLGGIVGEVHAERAASEPVDASAIPQVEWETEYTILAMRLGPVEKARASRLEPIEPKPTMFARGTPAASLAQRPRATYQPAPTYPFKLADARIEGEVVVGLLVDRKGRVADAKTISASDRKFAESTLAAVRRWRFKPGLDHAGKPADAIVVNKVVFGFGTGSPLTDAMINRAQEAGGNEGYERAARIALLHDTMLIEVDRCVVNPTDGISDLEAFRSARDFLVREAPGQRFDIGLPLDDGDAWKILFAPLPMPGPIGSMRVDKRTGTIGSLEINGKPVPAGGLSNTADPQAPRP